MLGLRQAIASSPEMVGAPEQASVLRLLPIALIGGILEALALSSFLNNSQNSIFFGFSKIYVSIVVRDVDDDIERVGHVSPLSGIRCLMSALPRKEDVGLTVDDFNWILRTIVRPAALGPVGPVVLPRASAART